MAATEKVSVSNLVQTLVQYPVFRETINSILTTNNQEQPTDIELIASGEIREREGSISPSSFYGRLPDY